ncbi:MAG TPA: hypothetical protein VEC35_09405 [Noviherbaspirillum sp.]|nr:hypothetical protein [Noviherbaspirillum sp.]
MTMPITPAAGNVPAVDELLASPEVSFWLKDSLRAALARDPVDAASDAELLARVLVQRMNDMLASCAAGRTTIQ